MINRYILNGRWLIDYLSDTPYTSETEPVISETSDSAVNVPVPGYWEDMSDLFRSTALHTKLKWNPLYTLQRYPQAGFVPDMYLANPVGAFVYQKTFSIDNAPDCAAELFIGGAQNAVSAWLNGAYLGRHEGYSAPFAFSVPNGVLKKGRNTVTLAVSNNRLPGYMNRPVSGLTSRAANECTGGVYGDVEIRLYPDGLKDAFVSVSKDLSFFTVHIEGAENAEKEIRILDGEKLVFSKRLTANENALSIPADGFERWSPDSPKTYTALVCTETSLFA